MACSIPSGILYIKHRTGSTCTRTVSLPSGSACSTALFLRGVWVNMEWPAPDLPALCGRSALATRASRVSSQVQESRRFAGQRPAIGRGDLSLAQPPPIVFWSLPGLPPSPPLARSSPVPILHPSMLIPPVDHLSTLAATVGSESGLRARTMGSHAGLSAVPQPSLIGLPQT